MSRKVLIGMSGGVDSSVAAMVLQKAGYEVTGVTMHLYAGEQACEISDCVPAEITDAKRVCDRLGIEHLVFEDTQLFRQQVIDPFADAYLHGETPNPCVTCNRRIKFGAMLDRALEMGFDAVATGHYARVVRREDGRYLLEAADTGKDQSYVLYSLTQHQLAHTIFPIGEYAKSAIRQMALDAGLPVASKPDSQDICFVRDRDYAGFIGRYTGSSMPPGEFVDQAGNVIGTHMGLIHYTIGQRKGLGTAFGEPMYVTAIEPETNRIVLGPDGSQYRSELTADDLNWISVPEPVSGMRVQAKVRYQARPAGAVLEPLSDGSVRVIFDEPQRSVTPGQAVVFYDGNLVVGGGTIRRP